VDCACQRVLSLDIISPDVTFCLQHGHVLSRDGYVCVHAEAEGFIASFIQQS
jgi:hypothetical protein